MIDRSAKTPTRLRRNQQRLADRMAIANVLSFLNTADSDPVADSIAEEDLLAWPIPAHGLQEAAVVRLTLGGVFEVAAASDLQLRLRAGAELVLDLGAVSLGTTGEKAWRADVILRLTAHGAAGGLSALLIAGDFDGTPMPRGSSSAALDLTQAHSLRLTAQWSVADAGNSITQQLFLAEQA